MGDHVFGSKPIGATNSWTRRMDQANSSNFGSVLRGRTRSDLIVVAAMAVIAIAVVFALSLQGGLPVSRSMVAGTLIFALLVTTHLIFGPKAQIERDVIAEEDEKLWQALQEQRRVAPNADRMAMATRAEVAEPRPLAAQSPPPASRGPELRGTFSEGSSPERASQAPSAESAQSRRDEVAKVDARQASQSEEAVGEASLEQAQQNAPPVAKPRHVSRRKPRILSKIMRRTTDENDKAPPTSVGGAPQPPVDAHTSAPAPAVTTDEIGRAITSDERHKDDDVYWDYRPSQDALSTNVDVERETAAGAAVSPTLDGPQTEGMARSPEHRVVTEVSPAENQPAQKDIAPSEAVQETDVALVQSMIKALADQVNAGDKAPANTHVSSPATDGAPPVAPDASQAPAAAPPRMLDRPPTSAVPPSLPTQAVPPPLKLQGGAQGSADIDQNELHDGIQPPQPLNHESNDMVDASVQALRTKADVMRDAALAAPEDAPQVAQPLRPAARPDAASVSQDLSAALSAGEYRILLDPIVNLSDLLPGHYEVDMQVLSEAGQILSDVDVEHHLQATSVLPEVDHARFIKTLSVARILRDRGKEGRIFTRIYRESLLNRDFCYTVATHGVADEFLANQIVLTMTQDAVASMTATEWQTLSDFRELGYGLAIRDVVDFTMDPAPLVEAGFTFATMDAGELVSSGDAPNYAQALAHANIELVVTGIHDPNLQRFVAGLGAVFGQGAVTGGARIMRTDAVAGGQAVA